MMVGWLVPWLVNMEAKSLIPFCVVHALKPTNDPHTLGGLQVAYMPKGNKLVYPSDDILHFAH
jgi:hypothetical protein